MDTGSRLPLGKVEVGQSQESTQDPSHTFLILWISLLSILIFALADTLCDTRTWWAGSD